MNLGVSRLLGCYAVSSSSRIYTFLLGVKAVQAFEKSVTVTVT